MIKLRDSEYWGYDESNYRILKRNLRLDVSYVGVGMSKQKFIDTIRKSGITDDLPTWIRERTVQGRNETSLKIAKDHNGKVVCFAYGFANQEIANHVILRILIPGIPVIVENSYETS